MMATPYQMEIIQQPEHKRIVMIFEGATHIWREIYMDGRAFPEGDALNPTYLGYSVGKWDGDTLVVDVVHFTDQTWLDRAGNFHSEALHLVERYTMTGPDHINYEATIEDSKVFTRPWKMSMVLYRRKEPNVRLLDYVPGLLMEEEIGERERRKTNQPRTGP
jgi:hypothetical protein